MPPEREVSLTAASPPAGLLAFGETRAGPAPATGPRPGPAAGDNLAPRVLVAGVGYTCLSDLSVGPALVERLAPQRWPPGTVVEDLSYGPIDVLFKLQASPPFQAGLFVTAAARGRAPGSLHRARWRRSSLPPDELQARIAEAISGVISLDNLLSILDHFGALPGEVIVLEIEPLVESWGTAFSRPVQAGLAEAERLVRAEVERLAGASRP